MKRLSVIFAATLIAFWAAGAHAQTPPAEVERIARSAIEAGRMATSPTQVEAGVHDFCQTFTGTFYGESPWWPRGSRVIVIHVTRLSPRDALLDQALARNFMESHGIAFTKPVCTGVMKRWSSENQAIMDQPENIREYPFVVTVDPQDGRPVVYPLSTMARYFQRLKHLGGDTFEFAWVQGTIRRNKPYSAPFSRLKLPQ
jgi:hypothetical protein